MLLEFKFANYKSFVEETTFSMIPAPKQKGLDYSIFTEKIGSKKLKGLSSAVIYGPNASGKTNLIGAMDTFRLLVLRGNIKNSDQAFNPNSAAFSLELIPNCNADSIPTMFSVRFTENGVLVDYSLTIELGNFLDKDYPRRISEEKLSINDKIVFIRSNDLFVDLPNVIFDSLNKNIANVSEAAVEIAKAGLNDSDLFLTNGFKSIFSKDLSSMITNWFEKKFMVIFRSNSIHTIRKFVDPKEDTLYYEKTLTEAASTFGINSNGLGYRSGADSEDLVLCSVFDDRKIAIPADVFESYGTIRFVNEFPLVINALANGGTLVMDEFDASIHPMALMNIISIFHNDDINKNHAQLIFNTHNPIFLDSTLFRRDEIKFVERSDDTHKSEHYSLSDFKTFGENGVRKGADYMKNYFISQYGAIKDVDFSPILEKIINEGGDVRHG